MKKIFFLYAALIAMCLGSCDKDFENVNKDPVNLTTLDPVYLFANAQRLAVVRTVDYEASIIQQIVTPFPGSLQGANHNKDVNINSERTFVSMYTGPVKLLADVINKTQNDATRSNLYNMARIWKAYIFQVLVDTYGDVPYFNAGKAYLEEVYLPEYDNAEDIYNDLLKELEEATNALDASKAVEVQDLFYKGNIAKWKRLGNSLLLRVAMRLSKVDQNKAKDNVVKAVDPARGGIIESVADNAMFLFNNSFNNIFVERFHAAEKGNYYLGAPFVAYLQSTNDPRLKEISVKYAFPANDLATAGPEDTDPTHQQGMPFGYDATTITTAPGYPGNVGAAWKYSQPNRRTITALTSPAFFVTASQSLLLRAEAVQRGWIAGDVAALYNAGVKAGMDQFKQFYAASEIPVASQNTYLAANPFNPATALEQINTQYWISSYVNWTEAWANFRRSGFPALTPNPYPQADPDVKGGFIRRLSYPDREMSVNEVNVKAAIAHQGTDNLSTRIFWDKP